MSFKRKFLKRAVLLGTTFAMLSSTAFAGNFSVANLQVNRQNAPLGLDDKSPFFGWQMNSTQNISQTHYQIIVKNIDGEIVWDSGKVTGDLSQNIEYAGGELLPQTPYTWTVRVWDSDGDMRESTSTFETGLNLNRQGLGDWDGAQWIGSNELTLDSHSLSVYQIRTKIKINKGSTAAGFIFGANDMRLMNAEKNLWNISSAENESRIEVILDISGLENSGNAKLKIFRRGYSTEDTAAPIVDFDIPTAVINNSNKNAFHEICLASNHGVVSFTIDNTEFEMPEVNFWSRGYVLNPAGPGGDYISYPVVGDVGFIADAGQKAEIKDFEILNFRTPANALYKIANYKIDGGNSGLLYVTNPSHGAMPILRTDFKLQKKQVLRARLYATARGIYDFYVNGQRVSDRYFAPELTQYTKTQLYQVYDVTNKIQQGKNDIGAQLAEGWWSGAITFEGAKWNFFGDRQSLLAKLVVTFTDGTEQTITTQPNSWQYSDNGPLIAASFFQGETYDARRENISNWRKAKVVPLDKTTANFDTWHHPITQAEYRMDYSNLNLIAQEGAPVQAVERRVAESVHKIADGVYIYDMGQNLAGVPNIIVRNGRAGQQVTMRFAEMLYPDNDAVHGGTLMLENIRGALATDNYILKGGNETIAPRFTYHGYRYIEITGLDELDLSDVGATVLSSAKDLTANFECSDSDINRLYQNIVWSTRANFLSIPTDCPQRNERMGWSGDLSVFAPTATYLWDADRFLNRHLQAVRDVSDDSGRFPDVAPIGGAFGGINWGSVGMTVPFEIYMQYGDKATLAEHYDAMRAYVDYLENHIDNDGMVTEGTPMQLGDWLGPENSKNDVNYLLVAAELNDLDIFVKSAEALGKNSDAATYRNIYNNRRNWFNNRFFDATTHRSLNTEGKLMDTQTSYAVALGNNVLNPTERQFAQQYLVEAVERTNVDDDKVQRPAYSLMTGFIGTAKISKALSNAGRTDIAYRMLENHQYPSWLYPVDQGATTIWERLNSYTKANGFGGNNSMNSFNHYSFGAVGSWLYSDSLGIQRDENNPGWKHFILQPQPDFAGSMTWAKGYFDSPYGRIESSWQLEGGAAIYDFVVPANTTATCKLISGSSITVNGAVQNISAVNGHFELNLTPGKWHITVK